MSQSLSARLLIFGVMSGGLWAVASCASAATWESDPSLPRPKLNQRLYEIGRKYGETNFDPDANLVGAQSKNPPNKKLHATRESAYYAFGLLLTGDKADLDRAQAILRRVLATQETKSQGPTRGAFGWYAENPPDDLNSAAFVGSALVDVIELDRRRPMLDAVLLQQVEASAKLAIEAILRRDVDPAYTNIAMLSIGVAAAGEKLELTPGSGAWAEKKLDAVLAMADDSDFAEYLSPTYYGVGVASAYAAKKYAFSPGFAAKVDDAINHFWKCIAASYHAPTYQLVGPYVRAYGDNMLEYANPLKYALYLALDGDYPMDDTDTDHAWDKGGLVQFATLPVEPRPEFKQMPPAWREFKVAGLPATPVRTLRQYRDGNFALGTVAFQDSWKQKRHLVAHWRTDGASKDDFTIGFCIDQSNEFIPAGVAPDRIHFHSHQVKDAVLVALSASTVIPGHPGVSALMFDREAKILDDLSSPVIRVESGSRTTYLYPLSNSPVTYETQSDRRGVRLIRPWLSADGVGQLKVMSYLVVFRPTGSPAPSVTDLTLKAGPDGVAAAAKVDGAELAVTFQR